MPLGSLLAALLAILLLQHIGWRGMFLIGALPLVTLLPLAYFKMPESVAWLASRGRMDEARAMSERTGVAMPEAVPTAAGEVVPVAEGKVGFAGLFSGTLHVPDDPAGPDERHRPGAGLLAQHLAARAHAARRLQRQGFAVLPAGAQRRRGARRAGGLPGGGPVRAQAGGRRLFRDRRAASIALLTLGLPLAALLAIVAIVGLGTSGTQTLIYGFVANYYRTNVRGAGVAWCAGFGRLGGVGGPLLGGFLIGGGFALNSIFYVLAGLGLLGVMLTLLVPIARRSLRTPGTPHPANEPRSAPHLAGVRRCAATRSARAR